ncbi:hypothetical protein EYA84_15545 [Verrucosispora sp. SN26_14.1]|uniref:hypothetical protein n=1 Tax=Verrucosispora sp. SN26_14.1 TaxID=2527879 RepID=UPI001033AB37|nr:hypothetical protein [Verrucosispora sp. SN26_14.1]TBL34420.1 hypothetical protein EYA84_15545 [Verrucosispora sp. SN26_14.1]
MTQPGDAFTGSRSMEWMPALRDVLGSEEQADPGVAARNTWIQLDTSFWQVTENGNQSPWNHWMPGDQEGWNRITLYRKRRHGGRDSRMYFQLIRGWVTFFEGGDDSPASHSQRTVNASGPIVSGIRANQFLDAQTFSDAAHLYWQVTDWLMNGGQPAVRAVVDRIDQDRAGFDGTAADAFVFAMADMARTMLYLKENITEQGDWVQLLNDNSTAIGTFKTAMENAWNAFVAYRYHDPNWLVWEVLRAMERQVDEHDARTSSGTWTAGPEQPWTFSFPDQGLGTYDLMSNDGWNQLNDAMKSTWVSNLEALNLASVNATQALITSFNLTIQAMRRGVFPLYRGVYYSPQDDNPFGNGPNNPFGNGPGGGGSGGSDFGGGPGGDEFGGANIGGGPGGSGSSGSFDPSGLGAGGSGGGSGGAFGDGGASGGSTGGPSAGGFDPSGLGGGGSSGTVGLDGLGGGTGGVGSGGAVGPGTLLPGLGGGVVGGAPGGGTSGGGSRPGSGGSGGLGGLTPPPTSYPSVVDPGAVGGVGSGGFDSGGSSAGLNGGAVIGPIGEPPPGYVAGSALPGFAGVAGNGTGAVTSGGFLAGAPFGPAGAAGAAGAGIPGMGGMGGFPMMPPMGGMGQGGGRDTDKDRERSTWLAEEEEVWGTDPDCAPAVIGRDDLDEADSGEGVRPGRSNVPSRGPGSPYGPTHRDTTRRRN